jgi:hypothetical protein
VTVIKLFRRNRSKSLLNGWRETKKLLFSLMLDNGKSQITELTFVLVGDKQFAILESEYNLSYNT